MIQPLRTYEIFERNKAVFHAHFRDHTMRIMRKYGFDFAALCETVTPERSECVYLLSWVDVAAKEAAWGKFRADEEWREITRVTRNEHGDFVGKIEDRLLTPTTYSPKASLA